MLWTGVAAKNNTSGCYDRHSIKDREKVSGLDAHSAIHHVSQGCWNLLYEML